MPPGWAVARLGEVADTTLGKMLDKAKSTGNHPAKYLRNVNVQWGKIDLEDFLTMDIHPDERELFALESGDLLVCEGGEVGRSAIWRGGGTEYIAFQKALHRVRPTGPVLVEYLRYYLEFLSRTGGLKEFSTGSTIKHLPQQRLREIPILLPPLAEQRRIVESLEGYLSRLGAASRMLVGANSRVSRLTRQLVGEKLRGAPVRPLKELLRAPLINGRSVPSEEGGFPVLRLTALKGGVLNVAEAKEGRWNRQEAEPFLVAKGDFFVSRGNGSKQLVGRGALLKHAPEAEVAFPDTMIRIRANDEIILSDFLRVVWDGNSVRRHIEESARTTAGIYKINQKILEATPVPVLTLEEQQEFIEWLEVLEAPLRQAEHLAQRAHSRVAHLRSALLGRAFSGALVVQDPKEESAEKHLERLRLGASGAIGDRARRSRTARKKAGGQNGTQNYSQHHAAQQEIDL
ncbi:MULTISPECIES: restriction endonuclease subunit S [unclassified Streptomyces]|uniref:restriction endonuclease subunit S n=1 Tax=unclassified Streptomyces TaxID=2593676 RepID=UPI0021D17934|nr:MULTISPECIES: restriction endonuclease subunit S [unclassified Streptomyces]MCU4748087.1 restriction endonuclease subunit S [Streptomyces sp. G-5]